MKTKIKKYVNELLGIQLLVERKKQHVQEALKIAQALHQATNINELLQLVEDQQKPKDIHLSDETGQPIKTGKSAKGDTFRITLQMFKKGKSIADIASERILTHGTVESHLAYFIPTGEVDILDLVTNEKLEEISKAIDKQPGSFIAAYKELLGPDYTYSEIRAVLKWKERSK